MAATPIYGKNPLKIFFSETKGPMTLGLGMQHRGHGPNKVCSNDDLGLTLTFLRQGQICFLILLYGKIYISPGKMLESHLMGKTYNKWPKGHDVSVDIKRLSPRGCLPLHRGYTCIKAWKNIYKIRIQRDLLNLLQMGKVKKPFCYIKLLSPRVVCPCHGAICMYKIIKNVYKVRFQKDFLFLLTSKYFVPSGLSAPAPGLYLYNV